MPTLLPGRGYGAKTRRNAAMTAMRQAPIVPTTNVSPTRTNVTQAMRTRRAQEEQRNQPTSGGINVSGPGNRGGQQAVGSSGAPATGTSSGFAVNTHTNPPAPPMSAAPRTAQPGAGLRNPAVGGTRVPPTFGGNVMAGSNPIDVQPGNEALQESPNSTDEAANQAIMDLLTGGPRDTAEDEALIRELMQHQAGAGQADLNARLGAAGFGTSGALGAMTSDLRQAAARKAAEDIMGVRQTARDDAFRDLGLGIEAEQRDRGLDITEQQYLDYMQGVEDENADIAAEEQAAEEQQGFWNAVGEPRGGAVKAEDAARAQDWPGETPLIGINIGHDDTYNYVMGVDGKIWREPHTG